MLHKILSSTALVLVFALFSGCGKRGPQIAPVHGQVTLNGQPLANADVAFAPQDGGRGSSGRTDADGRYQLVYKRGQPGAIVGRHWVQISFSTDIVKHPPKIAARFDTVTDKPEHRDVKPGDNNFDFDVTPEKK